MKLIYTNQNKNLLNASGKKIRRERQRRTWRTIKEVFGESVLPFPLVVKCIRTYKCVTQRPQEFVAFKFKGSFYKFCRLPKDLCMCSTGNKNFNPAIWTNEIFVQYFPPCADTFPAPIPTLAPKLHVKSWNFFGILQPNTRSLTSDLR